MRFIKTLQHSSIPFNLHGLFSTFKYIIDLPGLTIIRAAITRLLIYISIIICPIDDIIWLSYDNELTEKIEQALTNTCMEYELKLTFRKVSTNETGKRLEFLDVLHMIDNSNKFGLFTTGFIKETATKRLFLNGNSYHPLCIFKSIVLVNLLDYAD